MYRRCILVEGLPLRRPLMYNLERYTRSFMGCKLKIIKNNTKTIMHTTLINAETPISSSAVIVWVWVVAHTYEQWSWYQLVTVKQSLWLKWYKQIWQCVLIYSSFNSTRCCLQLLLMWRACKHLDQYRENNTFQIVNIGQLDKSFHWSLSVLNDGKLILNWWRLDKLHVYLIKKKSMLHLQSTTTSQKFGKFWFCN